MIENRIVVFRDRPDLDLLKSSCPNGFQLFKEKATGLYYLEPPGDGSDTLPFQSYFENAPVNCPQDFDLSFLSEFNQIHKTQLGDTEIMEDIIGEALGLSKFFRTRILSAYGNDEDTDFVAVAENGKLLRLRFKSGLEELGQISSKLARTLDTEILATRISPEEGVDAVFEFKQFEALQTEKTPLSLRPYWHFYEGEIGGQVVFSTISSTPQDVAPNLMFRNAYLEFREVFGKVAPDFDSAEDGAFYRVAFNIPKIPMAVRVMSVFDKPILLAILIGQLFIGVFTNKSSGRRRTWKWKRIAIVSIILGSLVYVKFLEPQSRRLEKALSFEHHCQAANGEIITPDKIECRVNGRQYGRHNLPGQKDEVRTVAFEIDPQTQLCPDETERRCLVVDEKFHLPELEGYTHQEGIARLVVVRRTQLCEFGQIDDCAATPEIFKYKLLKQFELPR